MDKMLIQETELQGYVLQQTLRLQHVARCEVSNLYARPAGGNQRPAGAEAWAPNWRTCPRGQSGQALDEEVNGF